MKKTVALLVIAAITIIAFTSCLNKSNVPASSGTLNDEMTTALERIAASVINEECWDVRGPGWEAPGIGSANKQITRMDVKTEIDPDEIDDGKPRPLVPHRGILANVADDELVPFMFVVSDVSKTVDKIHESLYMETEKILAGLLAKKLSINDELAWEYVEKKPIPSRFLLYPDLFLEELPEEEDREKFFERHVTFEVQQAIDEIKETDEYKIAVSAVYGQEEYLKKLESETAALRKKMADIEKTLAETGFKLIWDLDDEEWTNTLTYCGAVCVAAGTREQIFSLSDEALNGARPGANGLPRLYYAIRNPLTTSEILGAW